VPADSSRPWRVVWPTFVAIAAVVLAASAYVLSRPEAEMISFMADDAFYYLVPAHAFAHGDGWTLDHVTRTSGFQLLYGYAAAAVSLVTGYSRTFPVAMALSSAIAALAGVWLMLNRAATLYGARLAAAAIVLTLASPRALFQVTAGLEWGWVVLVTSVVVWVLTRGSSEEAAPASPALVAIASFVAVLARADLALFVAIYVVALTWAAWRNGAAFRQGVKVVAAAAAAAIAAIAVTAVNSWAITGHWIPNSIAMKAFWSRTNDFQPAISWQMLLACTGPGLILGRLRELLELRSAVVIGLFMCGAVAVCANQWRHGARRFALVVASTSAIAAYTIAYARGVNLIGDHYSASIAVPVALLTCGFFVMCRRYWPLAAGTMGAGALLISASMPLPANAAHLVIARHARSLFETLPNDSRVAGWNVGIASWMTGGRVMNLDGLANADVVASIQSGQLACYLSDTHVSHLMDFGFMFPGALDASFSKNEEARHQQHLARNGYDAPQLYGCLGVVSAATDAAFPASTYRLFAIDRPCMAMLCRRTSLPGRD
jgi:hypothetical protein